MPRRTAWRTVGEQTARGLRLYNTLTRTVEPFEPLNPPRVTFYACGPTVWNYAHIGNFRTFLFVDLLRRYLEYSGYDVFHVMNLTDVDDRTITAAAGAGTSVAAHTEPFAQAFFEDRDYLRIKAADVYPRATGYIGPMVELVTTLLDRGLAYRSEDGSVYFAVDRFSSYGRLARVEKSALKSGVRVASDEYSKEDARDFALWKAATPEDESVGAAWDAPFGRGRPGWHLECSAMALREVESRFHVRTVDIHTGAVDLIFPHHENEIAQSEGATGKPFVRHWVHGEFLNVSGTKMSKRFGNILTARDLREEGVDAAAFRLLTFQTHYRQKLNYTDEALAGAAEGVRRLGEFRRRLLEAAGGKQGSATAGPRGRARAVMEPTSEAADDPIPDFLERFSTALDDDLNAPQALAGLFSFIKFANGELDRGAWNREVARAALDALDRVMAVLDLMPTDVIVTDELRGWVEERITAREAARAARDFVAADAIRDELVARGVDLEDTPQGPRWRPRHP